MHHPHLGICYCWPKMLLRFGHTLLVHQIDSQWKAHPISYPSTPPPLRRFHCNDLLHCFSTLQGQGNQWRVLRDQALNRLYDSLEPNGVEVRVEVLDHSVVWCSCVRCFRSPYYWVSTGIVAGSCTAGTHHADTASLDSRIPVDVVSNLMVIFIGVLIDRCAR
jgi:hypothetical protein